MNFNLLFTQFFTILFAVTLSSCGRINNSSSDDRTSYAAARTVTGSEQFEAARAILKSKCSECHATWMAYTTNDFIASGLVTPLAPTSSKVYFRNQNGPGPDNNMPTQGRPAVTPTELQVLADWINSIQ